MSRGSLDVQIGTASMRVHGANDTPQDHRFPIFNSVQTRSSAREFGALGGLVARSIGGLTPSLQGCGDPMLEK